jgi:hydrogenase expression/formation protein HypC
MCLAIPMRIVSIEGPRAVVEQGGARRTIATGLLDEVKEGEYVLVHAGYAIARVDEEEARRTLELVAQLAGPSGADDAGAPSEDEARPGREDVA